MTDSGRLL